jgi:DNA-binding NtrC family response regulator
MNGLKQKLPQYFRILIVDDDEVVRKVLVSRLERKGHTLAVASSGSEAVQMAQSFKPEVLISDIRMPEMNGFEVIEKIDVPAIIITGHGDKESAIQAVEAGAFAFFEKPFDLDAIEVSVQRAGERYHMITERELLLRRLNKLCKLQDRELENLRPLQNQNTHLIGESKAIHKIRELLKQVSKKPRAPLLIQGETGSGKEVVAQELHVLTYTHPERTPFLALNCATVPQELFESELFGHEKGSFSGAHNQRIGLAEAVQNGTLFLDEIGDMAPQHQTKLLRFLQERKFRRVGSNKELVFRGRVIAASHKNLAQLVSEGAFREDLFYRLNIVTVEIPPLRERSNDIPLLAQYLSQKHGLMGVRDPERLLFYKWPGNVRELNNWIERASILELYDADKLIHASLPELSHRHELSPQHELSSWNVVPLASTSLVERRKQILEHYERLWIEETLEKNKGNISASARELGIDRKNLARRIKDLKIAA